MQMRPISTLPSCRREDGAYHFCIYGNYLKSPERSGVRAELRECDFKIIVCVFLQFEG